MNPITDFSKLLAAVQRLGIDTNACIRELEQGIEIDSTAEFVSAPNGFYDILPGGYIVRVLIHLAHGTNINPSRWHRYHIAPCAASVQPSRRNRSFKTRRSDGLFTYFIHDSYDEEYLPEERMQGRALKICGNCLGKLSPLGLHIPGDKVDLPKLLGSALALRLHASPIRHDLDRIYGFSLEDWKAIANYVKDRAAGVCSKCRIDYRSHPRHLHAHYLETRDNPATLGRVTVLCAGCHAMQKGHERLLHTPELAQFRQSFPTHPVFV